MKILSLFDGISCARVALERAGLEVEAYYASEIDKYAIQISQKNYPDIYQMGNVKDIGYDAGQFLKKINENESHTMGENYIEDIDLLIGGSPCQDLSIAKKNRKGLDGDRSGLFWEYVRLLKEVKPTYFVLENVASMPKEAKDTISEILGVQPIMINAALLSAQNRKRLFWTNIPNVVQPADKEIMLKDILLYGETEDLKALCITATYYKKNERDFLKKRSGQMIQIGNIGSNSQAHRVYDPAGKSSTLSALGGGQGAKTGLYKTETMLRKLHPIEAERLQGLPDNYTAGPSNSQRYKMLGNAFNVDVVAHILSFIKK